MSPRDEYRSERPRRPKWLWISLVIAVVVIVVLSVALIRQLTGEKSQTPPTSTTAAPQQSTVASAPPATSTAPQPTGTGGPSTTCEGYTASLDPSSPAGWQPTVGKRGLAYAVPPNWRVAVCGAQMGWTTPCPSGQQGVCAVRTVGAVSTLPNPNAGCEKSNLAMAGVAGSKNDDINAALDEETKTVPLIYTSQTGQAPTVELAPVREFKIGTHPAVQTVAKVTNIGLDPTCSGTAAFHSMVVTKVPNVAGSVVFLISLREGVDGAADQDVINQIVATLRSPA